MVRETQERRIGKTTGLRQPIDKPVKAA